MNIFKLTIIYVSIDFTINLHIDSLAKVLLTYEYLLKHTCKYIHLQINNIIWIFKYNFLWIYIIEIIDD